MSNTPATTLPPLPALPANYTPPTKSQLRKLRKETEPHTALNKPAVDTFIFWVFSQVGLPVPEFYSVFNTKLDNCRSFVINVYNQAGEPNTPQTEGATYFLEVGKKYTYKLRKVSEYKGGKLSSRLEIGSLREKSISECFIFGGGQQNVLLYPGFDIEICKKEDLPTNAWYKRRKVVLE